MGMNVEVGSIKLDIRAATEARHSWIEKKGLFCLSAIGKHRLTSVAEGGLPPRILLAF